MILYCKSITKKPSLALSVTIIISFNIQYYHQQLNGTNSNIIQGISSANEVIHRTEYQLLQMRQFLLFSLSSQKNYKFIYSFFGGLQIHRTSAATE